MQNKSKHIKQSARVCQTEVHHPKKKNKPKSTSNRIIKLIPKRYGSSTYFEHFNDLK